MFTRRRLVAGGLAAPLLWNARQALADAPRPPSIEELLRKRTALDVALSPDGSRVAILREQHDGDKRTAYVLLYRTDDFDAPSVRITVGDYDVEAVEWANDERLLIWLSFSKTLVGTPTGLLFSDGFLPIPVKRLMAVGADGKNEVVLFNNRRGALKTDFDLSIVADLLAEDPRAILMQMFDANWDAWALYRVDVYTGEATLVERGGKQTDFWFMQNGVPVLRYDSSSRSTVSIFARPPGETSWTLVRRYRRNELRQVTELNIVGATEEPGVLLLSSRAGGEEFRAIRTFDIRTLKAGEVVAHKEGRDLDSVFADELGRRVATGFQDDRRGYDFADPTFVGHFRGLNNFFGNEANVTLYDVNRAHTRFLFHVSGPRDSGGYFFYDRERKHLEPLAQGQPWLTQDRLAPMETLKIRSRDGVELTAYLTVPITPGPHPLVLLPHGGPEVRDTYDFDLYVQTLAAQGWMVLQPNFRGSDGYGRSFADAGRRRWGNRMQEDLEDAVDHVLATGRVLAGKVAIMGISYGGYAALMGAVRKPDLYRCAVSIAGDSDLLLAMRFVKEEDGEDSPAYEYWARSIGDPKTEKARLIAESPVTHVDAIKAPILLIHGSADDIVTAESSRVMAQALKKAGKPYEHLEIKGVGHRGWSRDTYKTVLERTTTFIAKAFA